MAKEMITYQDSMEALEPSHFRGFFENWAATPTPDQHLGVLRGSTHIVVARRGGEGPAVGFITCIADGRLAAYIPLLEVLPSYRNRGIGSELVRRLLEKLTNYYMIDVACDDEMAPFYERLGFVRSGSAMIRRNYQAIGSGPSS